MNGLISSPCAFPIVIPEYSVKFFLAFCCCVAGVFYNVQTSTFHITDFMKDITGAPHIEEFYSDVVKTHGSAKNLPLSCTSRLTPNLVKVIIGMSFTKDAQGNPRSKSPEEIRMLKYLLNLIDPDGRLSTFDIV